MNKLERTNEITSLELRDVIKMSKTHQSDEDKQKAFKKMFDARTFQKRSAIELRDGIMEAISKYPKSTHAISKILKTHPRVIKRHCQFLQLHNVIKSHDVILEKKTKDGRNFIQRNKYWSIVGGQ